MAIWHEKDSISLFTDGISLPGVTLTSLFHSLPDCTPRPGEMDTELVELVLVHAYQHCGRTQHCVETSGGRHEESSLARRPSGTVPGYLLELVRNP